MHERVPGRVRGHPDAADITAVGSQLTAGGVAAVLASTQAQGTGMLGQLKQLGERRDRGVLTESEFEAQKARILAGS